MKFYRFHFCEQSSIFRGSNVIGQLTQNLFHAQMWNIPLVHDDIHYIMVTCIPINSQIKGQSISGRHSPLCPGGDDP